MGRPGDYSHKSTIVVVPGAEPYMQVVGGDINRRLLIFSYGSGIAGCTVSPWVDPDVNSFLFNVSSGSPIILTWHDWGSLVTSPWYATYSGIAFRLRITEMYNIRG